MRRHLHRKTQKVLTKEISTSSGSKKPKKNTHFHQSLLEICEKEHKKDKFSINLAFNIFAKGVSDVVGNAWAFVVAMLSVLLWAISGYFFQFSDTWQLVINTATTVVTFLIVFLIQNTQNRDTEIINLKIDELIRAQKGAKNSLINLEKLSDIELKKLEKEYIKLQDKRTGE